MLDGIPVIGNTDQLQVGQILYWDQGSKLADVRLLSLPDAGGFCQVQIISNLEDPDADHSGPMLSVAFTDLAYVFTIEDIVGEVDDVIAGIVEPMYLDYYGKKYYQVLLDLGPDATDEATAAALAAGAFDTRQRI